MTVDMLAAAFIWPEEMLVGRRLSEHDLVSGGPNEIPTEDERRGEPETAPFWSGLLRRLRADAPASAQTGLR